MSLFSITFKTNFNLDIGILFGQFGLPKESIIFSFNNYMYDSIVDFRYSNAFGFTDLEVNNLLTNYKLDHCIKEVKEWYGGYLFGDTEIYNPLSVLNYILKVKQDKDVSFCINTAKNNIIVNYIKQDDYLLHNELEQLLQGKPVIKNIKPELTYKDMDNIYNIYSILLLAGYLKIKQKIDRYSYELVIPNKEVHEIYYQTFMEYFNSFSKQKRNEFVEALKQEDIVLASRVLVSIMKKSLSYYDNYESFYHGFLLGMINGYNVESNRESEDGRLDLIIYSEIFQDKAIVIECKHSSDENELMKDSKEAVKQIQNNHYLEGILAKGYEEVVGYGISFNGKQCYITKV